MNRTALRRILSEEGLTASEQEADKLDAEAEANEDQAEADRSKADAARMATGITRREKGELDRAMRAWAEEMGARPELKKEVDEAVKDFKAALRKKDWTGVAEHYDSFAYPRPDRNLLKKLEGMGGARMAGKVARYNWRDVEGMDPDEAMYGAERIRAKAGRTANEFLRHLQAEAYEANQKAEALEKAWDRWDWDALESFNVITNDEAEFVKEVLASYT